MDVSPNVRMRCFVVSSEMANTPVAEVALMSTRQECV
jgi:hypothetical protein